MYQKNHKHWLLERTVQRFHGSGSEALIPVAHLLIGQTEPAVLHGLAKVELGSLSSGCEVDVQLSTHQRLSRHATRCLDVCIGAELNVSPSIQLPFGVESTPHVNLQRYSWQFAPNAFIPWSSLTPTSHFHPLSSTVIRMFFFKVTPAVCRMLLLESESTICQHFMLKLNSRFCSHIEISRLDSAWVVKQIKHHAIADKQE